MRIKFDYGPYNSRRYGRPWGAIISANGSKLGYDFSAANYVGDDRGGAVYVECNPGDVIATGQRDNRGNGSSNTIYIVQSDGTLAETDRVGALEHIESNSGDTPSQLAPYSDSDLIAELERRGYSVQNKNPDP